MGVIGLGVMGEPYADILAQMPGAELVGVADVDEEKARKVGQKLGVPFHADYQGLLAQDDIQAVAICTPEFAHTEPAVAAAERGLHLMIEKPIASTAVDARRIIEAAADAGVKLMVGHILRFDPRYAAAEESVSNGDVGELIHMYARRSGLLAEGRYLGGRTTLPFYIGIHDIDIFLWLAGAPVDRVMAMGARKTMADLDVDDTVMALLHFQNGIVASLELSWALPDASNLEWDCLLEVVGTKGVIHVDVQNQGAAFYGEGGTRFFETMYMPQVAGAPFGVLAHEIAHFVSCVRDDRNPMVSGEDARNAVVVAEAMVRSLETGQPVVIEG